MKQARSFAIAVLWLAGSLPAASLPPRYDVVVLPSLEFNGTTLSTILAWDLSNQGHITGTASALRQSAGFLYTADGRLLGIDPPGDLSSVGLLVNDLGQVYGESVAVGGRDQFLFSEAAGARSLRDGLPKGSGQLVVHAINNRGVLVAGAAKSGEPLVYTPEQGWRNARELHPKLTGSTVEEELNITGLNDSGDFLFQIGRGSVPGSRFQRVETFLVTRDGDFHRFGARGNLLFPQDSPSEWLQVVGAMVEIDLPLEAFAWTPARGVIPISPQGAEEAIAGWSPIENVVAGEARFGQATDPLFLDGLFVRSLGGGGRSYTIRARRFQRLVRKAGFDRFLGVFAIEFNERLEFVGDVTADPGGTQIPYVVRGKRRPISLQSIVDAAGADLEVMEVIDLNRRGQILVYGMTSSRRGTSALLTPRD